MVDRHVPRETETDDIVELDQDWLLRDEDHAFLEEVELSLNGLEVALDDVLARRRGEGRRSGDSLRRERLEDLGYHLEGGGFVFLLQRMLLQLVAV